VCCDFDCGIPFLDESNFPSNPYFTCIDYFQPTVPRGPLCDFSKQMTKNTDSGRKGEDRDYGVLTYGLPQRRINGKPKKKTGYVRFDRNKVLEAVNGSAIFVA